ncbi:MAG: hypothetical protein GY810_16390 [Aureispira sp.]|nr:hypothetical protein [Aureispira sp.]
MVIYLIRLLRNTGDFYMEDGQKDKAIEIFKLALMIFETNEDDRAEELKEKIRVIQGEKSD